MHSGTSQPPSDTWSRIDHIFFREHLSTLSPSALKVYMCLLVHAPLYQAGPWLSGIHPSIRTIADEAHLSPTTVKSSIKELEQAGLLIVTRRDRRVNKYRLLRHAVSKIDPKKDKNKIKNPNPKVYPDYRDRKPDASGGDRTGSSGSGGREKRPERPTPIRDLLPQIPEPVPVPNRQHVLTEVFAKNGENSQPIYHKSVINSKIGIKSEPVEQQAVIISVKNDGKSVSNKNVQNSTVDPSIEKELSAHCPNINMPAALRAVMRHNWTLGEIQALIMLKQRDRTVISLDAVILSRLKTGRRLENYEPIHLERQNAKRRARERVEAARDQQWRRTQAETRETAIKRRERQQEDEQRRQAVERIPEAERAQIEQEARLNLSRENGLPVRMQLRTLVMDEMLRLQNGIPAG